MPPQQTFTSSRWNIDRSKIKARGICFITNVTEGERTGCKEAPCKWLLLRPLPCSWSYQHRWLFILSAALPHSRLLRMAPYLRGSAPGSFVPIFHWPQVEKKHGYSGLAWQWRAMPSQGWAADRLQNSWSAAKATRWAGSRVDYQNIVQPRGLMSNWNEWNNRSGRLWSLQAKLRMGSRERP